MLIHWLCWGLNRCFSWLLTCIVLSHLILQYDCFQHSLICCNITFRIRVSRNRLKSNRCTFHKCFHSSKSLLHLKNSCLYFFLLLYFCPTGIHFLSHQDKCHLDSSDKHVCVYSIKHVSRTKRKEGMRPGDKRESVFSKILMCWIWNGVKNVSDLMI